MTVAGVQGFSFWVRWFYESRCQLLGKECALCIGKLTQWGLQLIANAVIPNDLNVERTLNQNKPNKSEFNKDRQNVSIITENDLVRDIWALSWENRLFAYAKTKTQISFAVTAKLISAFVFAIRIVQFLYYLNPKFQASSHLLWPYSPVCVGPGRKPRRPVFSERGSFYPYRKQIHQWQGHPGLRSEWHTTAS